MCVVCDTRLGSTQIPEHYHSHKHPGHKQPHTARVSLPPSPPPHTHTPLAAAALTFDTVIPDHLSSFTLPKASSCLRIHPLLRQRLLLLLSPCCCCFNRAAACACAPCEWCNPRACQDSSSSSSGSRMVSASHMCCALQVLLFQQHWQQLNTASAPLVLSPLAPLSPLPSPHLKSGWNCQNPYHPGMLDPSLAPSFSPSLPSPLASNTLSSPPLLLRPPPPPPEQWLELPSPFPLRTG